MLKVELTANTGFVLFLQMIPSESRASEEKNKAPVKAKRSKPEMSGGDEDEVYHPVKLSRSDLYRPPTAEELNQLKETESLFHCSLLKMQVRREKEWGYALNSACCPISTITHFHKYKYISVIYHQL